MRRGMAFLIWAVFGVAVYAQTPSPEDNHKQDMDAAFQAGFKVAVSGKNDVILLSEGILHLPAGYVFVPQPEAGRMARAMGNTPSDSLIGLIFPAQAPQGWLVSLNFIQAGYIRDEDAKTWKASNLLSQIQDEAADTNKDRASHGLPELQILGWAQSPLYDSRTHRLVWATKTHVKSQTPVQPSINYNAYALGRDGFFSFGLLTPVDDIAAFNDHTKTLLSSLEFNSGKRYEEFTPADAVAAYKIDALVVGLPASKPRPFGSLLAGVSQTSIYILCIPLVISLAALAAMLFRRKQRTA